MSGLFSKAGSLLSGPRGPAVLIAAGWCFITLRIIAELFVGGFFAAPNHPPLIAIVIQWYLWYAGTFILVLACVRHLGGVPLRKTLYLLLLTPVLLVPMAIGFFMHTYVQFAYLDPHDPMLWPSIASLMYLNARNHYMFYEFIVISVAVPVFAYHYNKSVARSIVTGIGAYLAVIFLQGFIYICSDAGQCVFYMASAMNIYIFMCLYVAVTAALWLCLLLWPELTVHTGWR